MVQWPAKERLEPMQSSRRSFLKVSLAAAAGGPALAQSAKLSAVDQVTLGRSGVKVTRLAFGTGTVGGSVQRALGQDGFTRLVRYAYDRGIRFFETAERYRGMPEMLATALKGLPRESYTIMTKFPTPASGDPSAKIDEYRKLFNSDYLDILLLHCLRPPTWAGDYASLIDGFSLAKDKKIIHSHGASVHGLQALRTIPGNKWLDLTLLRINHDGTNMDTLALRDTPEKGDVPEVVTHMKKIHAEGMGVIGMKLIGEGKFTRIEDREAAMRYAFSFGSVDAVTIGFKSPEEIDESIERMNRVLNLPAAA